MDSPVALFKLATIKQITTLLGGRPMEFLAHEIGNSGHYQEMKVKIKNAKLSGSLSIC
jgi:hypothetical protein